MALMSSEMLGQYILPFALWIHWSIPRWESSCNSESSSGQNLVGITIRVPFTTTPSIIDSSSLKIQKLRIDSGHCLISLGQPCTINSFSMNIWGSLSLPARMSSSLDRLAFNSNDDMSKFNPGTVGVFELSGPIFLLRGSAKIMLLPGLYSIVTSYFCNLSKSLCNLSGAFTRSFLTIEINGLWSDGIMVDQP